MHIRALCCIALTGIACTTTTSARRPDADALVAGQDGAADSRSPADLRTTGDPATSVDDGGPTDPGPMPTDGATAGDPLLPPADTASRYALDTLAQPPNGKNLRAPDSGSNALLHSDNTPGAAGDLFGLFYCGDGSSEDRFYLLASPDLGASWSYVAASNAEPSPDPQHNVPWASTLTQDTVTSAVHHAFWQVNAAAMRYDRVRLSHDPSGHVNGWSWESQNQPGPAFNVAGGVRAKLDMREAIDGNGAHILLVAAIDCPSANENARLVVARTAAGASALAPAATADWLKLDGTAGYDALGAYWIGTTGTDPAALANYQNQDTLMGQHTADHTWAELPAGRSLHFFFGPYYYNDGGNHGQIDRWRFTATGSTWTLDPLANGVVVAAESAYNRPMMGSAVATTSYVWFAYGSPQTGLRFDRIDAAGQWAANALPSPDTTVGADWYVTFSVSVDETRAWALWAQPYGPTYERSGYFNGTAWRVYDDSTSWQANDAADPVSWLGVGGWQNGAGVMGYTYDTYGAASQKYHIHTIASPE